MTERLRPVLKQTRFGSRAIPIPQSEFDQLMQAGRLQHVGNQLYKVLEPEDPHTPVVPRTTHSEPPAPPAQAPEDLDSIPDEDEGPSDRQDYQTRDMTPAPPPRRGRPRKKAAARRTSTTQG